MIGRTAPSSRAKLHHPIHRQKVLLTSNPPVVRLIVIVNTYRNFLWYVYVIGSRTLKTLLLYVIKLIKWCLLTTCPYVLYICHCVSHTLAIRKRKHDPYSCSNVSRFENICVLKTQIFSFSHYKMIFQVRITHISLCQHLSGLETGT